MKVTQLYKQVKLELQLSKFIDMGLLRSLPGKDPC